MTTCIKNDTMNYKHQGERMKNEIKQVIKIINVLIAENDLWKRKIIDVNPILHSAINKQNEELKKIRNTLETKLIRLK